MVNHQTDINFTDARDLHFVAFCGLFYVILLPPNLKNYTLQTIWYNMPLVSINTRLICFAICFLFFYIHIWCGLLCWCIIPCWWYVLLHLCYNILRLIIWSSVLKLHHKNFILLRSEKLYHSLYVRLFYQSLQSPIQGSSFDRLFGAPPPRPCRPQQLTLVGEILIKQTFIYLYI